jgi:hypothetical protein
MSAQTDMEQMNIAEFLEYWYKGQRREYLIEELISNEFLFGNQTSFDNWAALARERCGIELIE